jgi:multisubunit Na+/H+ antiporter MnhG subunit
MIRSVPALVGAFFVIAGARYIALLRFPIFLSELKYGHR